MNLFNDGRAHILMCRPDFYDIEYAINPWMDRARQADRVKADAQWHALADLLRDLGAVIHEMPAVHGLPDLVFTANAALVYCRQAVISHFRHPQRQGEEAHSRQWFAANGFTFVELSEGIHFEGAGDALFCGDTLFAGYQTRSDAAGHQTIAEQLGVRAIPLELVNSRFYHLDMCFCPLAPDTAVYYPDAFDEYGCRAIEEHIRELIAVKPDEAERFACNAVVVGKSVVTHTGCPALHETLRQFGYEPHAIPLDEFLNAGGSAKCLTLRLDGEEAAAWKGPA